jgi:hypothetical protein
MTASGTGCALRPPGPATCSPGLLTQSEYDGRLKKAGPLMEAALRWLADQAPGSAELLRLMDGTPVPCGHSVVTARRSDLAGYAGYGYCASRRLRARVVQRLLALNAVI